MEFKEAHDSERQAEVFSASDTESGCLNDTWCYDKSVDHPVDAAECESNMDDSNDRSYDDQRPLPPTKQTPAQWLRDISVDDLPAELQCAFRILSELLSDSNKLVVFPFLDKIDPVASQAYDYYERIKHPMWMKKVADKFRRGQYKSIAQFIADVHLMIENCYNYNGHDHPVSKKARKLEVILEQKLVLLPRDIQEKARVAVLRSKGEQSETLNTQSQIGSTRSRRLQAAYNSNWLSSQVRSEERDRQRDQRRQQMQERRLINDNISQELDAWVESLIPQEIRQQLNAMWELPQIGLVLFLCSGSLNLGDLTYWELERCMVLPRESRALQLVMTSLMSTPLQRERIGNEGQSLMPYCTWEEKLHKRVTHWYKVLHDSGDSVDRCCQKIGIDGHFFKVLGIHNPLEGRKFHELSFYQRVCMLKALCEHCVETEEYLRDTIELQPPEDHREYVLGIDASGATYLNFPQFCGADMRIYRQAKYELPTLDVKPMSSRRSRSRARGRQKRKFTAKRQTKSGRQAKRARLAVSDSSSSEDTDADESDDQSTEAESDSQGTSQQHESTSRTRGSLSRAVKAKNDALSSPFGSTKGGRLTKTSMRAKMLEFMTLDESPSVTDGEITAATPLGDVDNSVSNGSKRRREKGSRVDFQGETIEQNQLSVDKLNKDKFPANEYEEKIKRDVKVENANDDEIFPAACTDDLTTSANTGDELNESISCLKMYEKQISCDMLDSGVKSDEVPLQRIEEMASVSPRTSSPVADTAASGLIDDVGTEQSNNGAIKNEERNNVDGDVPVDSVQMDVAMATDNDISATTVQPLIPLPDIGPSVSEFELVADSVENLRQLIGKLANKPDVAVATTNGKRCRGRASTESVGARNERKLVERLELLLQELEPWEAKLQQCNRRAKMKLMQDVENYKEECRRQEKMAEVQWESEESEADDAASSGNDSDSVYTPSMEGNGYCRTKRSVANKSASGARYSSSTVLNEMSAELGVSSWGRLRKRRIIPNNIEDQGMTSETGSKIPVSSSDSRFNSPSRHDSSIPAVASHSSSDIRSGAVESRLAFGSYSKQNGTVGGRSSGGYGRAPRPLSAAAAQERTRHLRVSWDQLQQMGITRMPGSDTLYIRPQSLGLTASSSSQLLISSSFAPPINNGSVHASQQQCQKFELPADIVREIVARTQQPATTTGSSLFHLSRSTNVSSSPKHSSNATIRTSQQQQVSAVGVTDKNARSSSPAANNSASFKVIIPSSSVNSASASPSASSSAVRMILPGGQNVLVKHVPNKSSNNASKFSPARTPLLTSTSSQKLLSPPKSDLTSALNPLASASPTQSDTGDKQTDGDSSNGSDNLNRDGICTSSLQVNTNSNSISESAIPEVISSQDTTAPTDCDSAIVKGSLAPAEALANSSTLQLNTHTSSVTSIPATLPSPVREQLVSKSALIGQPPVLHQNLSVNDNVALPSSAISTQPQQIKAVQLTDSAGNIVRLTQDELQKALEAAVCQKKVANDHSTSNTMLPAAQVNNLPTLDLSAARKLLKPDCAVTSLTASMPFAGMNDTAEEIISLSSSSSSMDSEGLSESLDESLPLDAESTNACVTNGNQQIVCVERAVGGGVATIERTTMKTPRRHHNVINGSSQTRLLDLSGIATFNRSKPLPIAHNARASHSAARKVATLSTGGQPVILQQASVGNVVLGHNIAGNGQFQLAQHQSQQQQQVFLLPGNATAAAMLPLVVGSSPSHASPTLPNNISVQPQIAAAALDSVPLQSGQIVLTASSKAQQQQSSVVSPHNQQLLGDSGTNSVSSQQQQHYVLLNINGQIVAAQTTAILNNGMQQ